MKKDYEMKLMEMEDLYIEQLAMDVTNLEDIIELNKLMGIDTTDLELDVLDIKRGEF